MGVGGRSFDLPDIEIVKYRSRLKYVNSPRLGMQGVDEVINFLAFLGIWSILDFFVNSIVRHTKSIRVQRFFGFDATPEVLAYNCLDRDCENCRMWHCPKYYQAHDDGIQDV